MSRVLRLFTLAVVAVCAIATSATAQTRLVLDQSGARGWHRVSLSARAAKRELSFPLPAGSLVEAAGARTRGLTLHSEAYSLPSAPAANRLDVQWARRHHARPLRIGQGGRLTVRQAGRGDRLQVLWRRGARLGFLTLRTGTRPRDPSELALGWARLADTYLRSALPRDAWQRALDEIRPNGSFTQSTALQAFAAVYGPVPGVRSKGTGLQPRSAFSGTLAARMVLRYLRRLSASQRAVVERRLGVRVLGHRGARTVRAGRPDYGDRGFTYDGVSTALAIHWASIYAAKLGHPLALRIVVGRERDLGPVAEMDQLSVADKSGAGWAGGPGFCRIRVGPKALDLNPVDRGWLLAHEVFHCFEDDITQQNWPYMPAWIAEGEADWAASTIDPVYSERGIAWTRWYINTPHTPLFERSYDAASFFGHVEDAGGDEWPRLTPTLLAPSAEQAFSAAGGALDASLATWGSSLFRVAALGLPWQMISPIRPLGFGQMAPGQLGLVPGPAVAPPYTTAQYVLDDTTGSPLVHFEIPGHARLSWHRSEYTDLRNAWFCTDPGGCHCPPGMEGSPPPSDPLGPGALVGVTGDPGGNAGNVAAHRLSEFCHPEPKPRPPGGGGTSHGGLGCSTHCGSANGDPHLETFDGYDYDFQAAGEFTAVKSTTDDLEIQERQEPFASLNATVVTAVAMRVAGTRVEIDRGAPLGVRLNGARTVPGSTAPVLPGGGTVARVGDEITVVWPDGTELQAWGVGPWGVAYLVEPATERAGHLAGLLGRYDGDARHLAGRDGHVYDAASLEGRRGFAVKYHRFGESWRIKSAASLFIYPRGKTTASYTDRRVPRKIVTAGSLPAHVRIAAERTCRANGIRRPLILRDCVLDIALTKQRTFAASGATLQHTAGARHVTTPPPPPPSGGGGAEHFQTTCYGDGKVVPAGSVTQASPGVSAGIFGDLEPSVVGAHTIIHWTAPPGTIDEPVSEGDTVFADLDTPGMYSVYVSYGGDRTHGAARSATCSWNVAG